MKFVNTVLAGMLLGTVGVFSAIANPEKDRAVRTFASIQADVNALDKAYVHTILAAYIDGIAVADANHPDVLAWRDKLVTQTDPVMLANEFHPRAVRDSMTKIVDDSNELVIDLLFRVWQQLETEAEINSQSASPVSINSQVPGGKYPSGVDPSAIEDPALRAEYEQAIREGRNRAVQNNRAVAIQQAYSRFVRRVSRVLADIGSELSINDRETLLISPIRESEFQGSEELLKVLLSQ